MAGDSVLGLREMLHGLFHFWDGHINKDGAWWILALDGVLLIPLIFAGFFYPMAVLLIVAGTAVLTLAAIALRRMFHVRTSADVMVAQAEALRSTGTERQ